MPDLAPSIWQKTTAFWVSRTGIDWTTYKIIFKDTLAPAIGLAANQAAPWSNLFGTLGFLVPMASIISRPSPPRAEFLWTWVANMLGSCVSATITALAFFCVVKAREQSEAPVVEPKNVPYNSVASTVAAMWLIAQVYVASAVRHNYPSTTWMISACLIFSNYGMVYVVQFPDMTKAWSFLQQLLLAHLVGFAISAGVSLLLFPTNSRDRFFKTVSDCTGEIQTALRTNVEIMERTVNGADSSVASELDAARKQHKTRLDSLQASLVVQLKDAQNELAWGVLTPADLHTLTRLLEQIIIPVIGLCRVPDIMERTLRDGDSDEKDLEQSAGQYRQLLRSVIDPFRQASVTADAALRRSGTILGLNTPSRPTETPSPDREQPLRRLQRDMSLLVDSKTDLLDAWSALHGSPPHDPAPDPPSEDYDRSRTNLHMLLYTEILLWSISHRIHALLLWAEELQTSQPPRRKHLILPALKSLSSPSSPPDRRPRRPRPTTHHPSPLLTPLLRPLRHLTAFFASPASSFALRVTAATMSVAILAYLPATQAFYIRNHLVWAQYAVSYAMQGSAGQGVRALAFRMGGTVVAVCLAWASWYVVSGRAAGVLVFYWVSLHFPMWIVGVRGRFATVGTVSAFALTTVLGNALMEGGGGGKGAFVLGAVRLGALGGGCLLATVWTLLPFPVSDRDGARGSLGACLACLAEYHVGFHEIVTVRLGESLKGKGGGSGDGRLEEMHARLLVKCNSHLRALQARLKLTKWNVLTDEVLFSSSHYERAGDKIENLMRDMQLITFAMGIFIDFVNGQTPRPVNRSFDWLADFRDLFDAAQHDGLGVATLLGLLSHSIRYETCLPPKLVPPGPEKLWRYFDEPKRIAQQVKQVGDPGAAMFALMRIGTKGMYRDLGELFEIVKDMVGEFDFVCGFAVDDEE